MATDENKKAQDTGGKIITKQGQLCSTPYSMQNMKRSSTRDYMSTSDSLQRMLEGNIQDKEIYGGYVKRKAREENSEEDELPLIS